SGGAALSGSNVRGGARALGPERVDSLRRRVERDRASVVPAKARPARRQSRAARTGRVPRGVRAVPLLPSRVPPELDWRYPAGAELIVVGPRARPRAA